MYVYIWSFFVPKYVPVFDTKNVTDYKLGITLKFQNDWISIKRTILLFINIYIILKCYISVQFSVFVILNRMQPSFGTCESAGYD